eukprot:1519276-Rhodomonas_salina.1
MVLPGSAGGGLLYAVLPQAYTLGLLLRGPPEQYKTALPRQYLARGQCNTSFPHPALCLYNLLCTLLPISLTQPLHL